MTVLKQILLFFALFVTLYANAQDDIFYKNKVLHFDSLLKDQTNTDTIVKYIDSSKYWLNKGQTLLSNKDVNLLKAKILEWEGIVHLYKGKYVKASNTFTDALSLYRHINNKEGIASCYGNIGYAYSELNNYPLAIEYYLKALKLSKEISKPDMIATQYNNMGEIYRIIGRYDEAINLYKKCIKIYDVKKDTLSLAYIYNNLATVYKKQGKYNSALTYYNKALSIMQIKNDNRSIATILSNIGVVYQEWDRHKLSLDFFKKALKYDEKSNNIIGKAIRYNNIASSFEKLNMLDSALRYYDISYNIFSKYNLHNYAATIKTNKANLYIQNNNYSKAIKLLEESADIFKEIKNNSNLIKTYYKLAYTYYKQKKYSQVKTYLDKCISQAKEINNLSTLSDAYKLYADMYALQNNYANAYKYLLQFIDIKDSIFSNDNMKQINSFQVKYNTIAQENKIKLLENENKIKTLKTKKQEVEIQKQKIITYITIFGFVIIGIFLILILRQYKAKKRSHDILKRKNNEIKRQAEEIAIQRDLVIEQKDLITEQTKYLTDSINYARHIQQAVLPSKEQITELFKNHFIIYKPLDIISGDFYWVRSYEYNNKKYKAIVVADSTGHGVPGAFMSMLGLTSINDIFTDMLKENTPAYVLNNLRIKVISALNQYGKIGEAKDGMDVSIAIICEEDKTLQFSGANHDLLLLTKNEKNIYSNNIVRQKDGRYLYRFKGDRMPVGISNRLKNSFTSITINYSEGDIIYMKTDGYTDQFGGPNSKKFKSKKLYDLLIDISSDNIEQHKIILETELNKWMNYSNSHKNQIDDILFVGIKLQTQQIYNI